MGTRRRDDDDEGRWAVQRTARRATTTTTGLALTVLLTACAGGGGTPQESTSPATSPAATSTPTAAVATTSPTPDPAPEPTDDLGELTAPGTEATAEGDAAGYVVTAVRTGVHDGYDRVVYELTGGQGVPGYRVGYVDQAVEDPSGETRTVDGDAILQVWLVGTTYPVDGGPQEVATDLRPGGGGLVHVVRPLTFEAMTQSFVGVAGGPRPFRVLVLADPARVVVDVQAG